MVGELILIVDDEPNIVALGEMYLTREGFQVESVGDGFSAIEAVRRLKPALMILDLMLPKMDGLEVCRKLRASDDPVLILMLTARDQDIDKILGLEMGADDYMTKPYNPRELVARVKAILRRTKRKEMKPQEVIVHGDLMIDRGGREIRVKGKGISLRAQEFDLLVVLASNPGIVLSRDRLLDLAWGFEYGGETRTVDVHIAQLRKKLSESNVVIETVTGIGYKFMNGK